VGIGNLSCSCVPRTRRVVVRDDSVVRHQVNHRLERLNQHIDRRRLRPSTIIRHACRSTCQILLPNNAGQIGLRPSRSGHHFAALITAVIHPGAFRSDELLSASVVDAGNRIDDVEEGTHKWADQPSTGDSVLIDDRCCCSIWRSFEMNYWY